MKIINIESYGYYDNIITIEERDFPKFWKTKKYKVCGGGQRYDYFPFNDKTMPTWKNKAIIDLMARSGIAKHFLKVNKKWN